VALVNLRPGTGDTTWLAGWDMCSGSPDVRVAAMVGPERG
jgi:hypothetical protein